MAVLRGELFAESPIYRGNARKTLFTRDGDGTQRLVSLAGEISGTAQALMDAFIGSSRDGKNLGLLNRLWYRLYGEAMPPNLISKVECQLQKRYYTRDRFFDLRMGIKLDENRWAAEANANYKLETLFRNAGFDFAMWVDDALLRNDEIRARLYYLLQELQAGRFWFGAGKSKGLGRCRLSLKVPFEPPATPPSAQPNANHLTFTFVLDAANPVLVGWNWGKLDPEAPAFAAIEGRFLLGAMKSIPTPIRERLEMAIGGPIVSPEHWKKQLADFLPRTLAVWFQERCSGEKEVWMLPASALEELGKGKFPLSKKLLNKLQYIADQPFESEDAAREAVSEALAQKKNMIKRVMEYVEQKKESGQSFDAAAWQELVDSLRIDPALKDEVAANLQDEKTLTEIFREAVRRIMPTLFQQVDRQVKMLQSDPWVDAEIANREEHLKIKTLILEGRITEEQWQKRDAAPPGVKLAAWQEFLEAHARVKFQHITNRRNLQKSIENDKNHIAFLKAYRERVRQELAQPQHIDFRPGGPNNREISQEYGKPYDTMFMRMLTWSPSGDGQWELYIPGSTLKGAFRKRAAQVLRTLWGETPQTQKMLDLLFGAQGQRGKLFFSDAYLQRPETSSEVWCSMDGVKMDPQTFQPIEEAKADYLFACGPELKFDFQIDIQDLTEAELEAFACLAHLIRDFQLGNIPIGGQKSHGMGWIQAQLTGLHWLSGDGKGVTERLFGKQELHPEGIWQALHLEGEAARQVLEKAPPIPAKRDISTEELPRAPQGFISHRAFGGYCGTLVLEGEILTPTNIKESGEPSFRATLDGEPINGWDFYALAPPANENRPEKKTYALPSKSIRGMVRHIYSIAADCREDSPDISRLNAVDHLFGWVGRGPNQALASRLSFSFAKFEDPTLAWFKIPYPYGNWQFEDGEWRQIPRARAKLIRIADHWRLIPHAPVAPNVVRLEDFQPDEVQAVYVRAILPGSRCRFSVKFWNLTHEELQRLLWCLVLEPELAHKIGRARYLGFGSLRLHLLPDSHYIHWNKRYDGEENDWKAPIRAEEWIDTGTIAHYEDLRKVLNAEHI